MAIGCACFVALQSSRYVYSQSSTCMPRRHIEGEKVQHHSFLTLALNVGGLSASHSSRFTSGIYWTETAVDPSACL